MTQVKEPLKVGDRIRVYGGYRCVAEPGNWSGGTLDAANGIVTAVIDDNCIYFKSDTDYCVHSASPNQVRRIVKKKRMEWWGLINKETCEAGSFQKSLQELHALCHPGGIPSSCEVVHVREVKK